MEQLTKKMYEMNPRFNLTYLEDKVGNPVHDFLALRFVTKEEKIIPFEKLICAQSTFFFGTRYSTFTYDIQGLRYGFRKANDKDSFLCENISFRK